MENISLRICLLHRQKIPLVMALVLIDEPQGVILRGTVARACYERNYYIYIAYLEVQPQYNEENWKWMK